MVYLLHHLATLGLCAGTTPVWLHRSWRRRSPRVTVIAGQSTMFGAGFAIVGAFLSAGLAPYGEGIGPGLVTLATGATDRPALGIAHLCSVAVGCAIAVGMLTTVVRCGYRTERRRRRLRALLSLVSSGADPIQETNIRIIDHPVPAAYCIPGRHSNVVISRGTLRALGPDELRAVIDHERAHIAMRHDLALLPFVTCYRLAGRHPVAGRMLAEMQLLIEMCADDHAARRHGRGALHAALIAFQRSGTGSAPGGTLGAADIAVAERCARLARPPKPLPAAVTLIATAAAVALAATPVSLYILPLSGGG